MGKAFRARARLVTAVAEFYEALHAHLNGKDPGSRWGDMSDVSSVIVNRNIKWISIGATPQQYASSDALILWAMNVNANPVTFWLLWSVYSQPGLRAEILEEFAPYVKVVPSKSGLSIAESPRLSIDIDGLYKACPLFKSTFYETMRLYSPSTSYKVMMEDFQVSESEEDATRQGKSQPNSFKLPKGQFLCIPNGVHQKDARYWKDPEMFNPRRFIVTDEKDPSKSTVDLGTMRVWGGGPTMCKGRNFAEREVLVFAASILSLWDIEPASGKWEHPGATQGASVMPLVSPRVRISKRVTERSG